MKALKCWLEVFFLYASIGYIIFAYLHAPKNVVTQVPAVERLNALADQALDRVSGSANRDSAIKEVVRMLPGSNDESLESKIAHWANVPVQNILWIKFSLYSNNRIKAESFEIDSAVIVEGYTQDQILVTIKTLNEKLKKYFLKCKNGLIEELSEAQVLEISTMDFSQTVEIPVGGSLAETLGMDSWKAYQASQYYNLPRYYKNGQICVLVFPGEVWKKDSTVSFGWLRISAGAEGGVYGLSVKELWWRLGGFDNGYSGPSIED